MNGETETGVTTFFIDEAIDTGKILFSEKMNIGNDEDAGSLHDRMKVIGAELVVKTLDAIAQGDVSPLAQEKLRAPDAEHLKTAPKIHPADCIINWQQSASAILNQIRGLSPYPAAFTHLKHDNGTLRTLKIYKAKISDQNYPENPFENPSENVPGTIMISDNKKQCFVATTNAWIELLEIQIDGKKRMSMDDFMRGFDVSVYKIV